MENKKNNQEIADSKFFMERGGERFDFSLTGAEAKWLLGKGYVDSVMGREMVDNVRGYWVELKEENYYSHICDQFEIDFDRLSPGQKENLMADLAEFEKVYLGEEYHFTKDEIIPNSKIWIDDDFYGYKSGTVKSVNDTHFDVLWEDGVGVSLDFNDSGNIRVVRDDDDMFFTQSYSLHQHPELLPDEFHRIQSEYAHLGTDGTWDMQEIEQYRKELGSIPKKPFTFDIDASGKPYNFRPVSPKQQTSLYAAIMNKLTSISASQTAEQVRTPQFDEYLDIQSSQLKEWQKTLKPHVFEQLQTIVNERNGIAAEPSEIPRGISLENIIHNDIREQLQDVEPSENLRYGQTARVSPVEKSEVGYLSEKYFSAAELDKVSLNYAVITLTSNQVLMEKADDYLEAQMREAQSLVFKQLREEIVSRVEQTNQTLTVDFLYQYNTRNDTIFDTKIVKDLPIDQLVSKIHDLILELDDTTELLVILPNSTSVRFDRLGTDYHSNLRMIYRSALDSAKEIKQSQVLAENEAKRTDLKADRFSPMGMLASSYLQVFEMYSVLEQQALHYQSVISALSPLERENLLFQIKDQIREDSPIDYGKAKSFLNNKDVVSNEENLEQGEHQISNIDIEYVANHINMTVTTQQIDFVKENYSSELKNDPTALWSEAVEKLLYESIKNNLNTKPVNEDLAGATSQDFFPGSELTDSENSQFILIDNTGNGIWNARGTDGDKIISENQAEDFFVNETTNKQKYLDFIQTLDDVKITPYHLDRILLELDQYELDNFLTDLYAPHAFIEKAYQEKNWFARTEECTEMKSKIMGLVMKDAENTNVFKFKLQTIIDKTNTNQIKR